MILEATEIPESPMRFFTPDLFLRVNSASDAIADAAQDEWDRATEAYRHHLKKVLRTAPRSIVELSECCYHDAAVSGMTFDAHGREPFTFSAAGRMPTPVPRPSPATLKLTLPGRSAALVYLVWDGVRVFAPAPGWSDRSGVRLWLYDEIDEVWSRFGMFVHRILFSTGEVWEVPLYDVVRVEVTAPVEK